MTPEETYLLITGRVEKELLLRNEYLAAENRILRSKIQDRIKFTDEEKMLLARLGKYIGKKGLKDLGCIVTPGTVLRWYTKFIAKKFDSSKIRKNRGRPRTPKEIERFICELVMENPSLGNRRFSGILKNLGIKRSHETIRDIRKRNGLPPEPRRKPKIPWHDFIKLHEETLMACDFFTVDVISKGRVATFYVLFIIHIATRQVHIAGMTEDPNEEWMKQIARNLTMAGTGFLSGCKYLIMDRDGKFCPVF